jgi:hypothetical protein
LISIGWIFGSSTYAEPGILTDSPARIEVPNADTLPAVLVENLTFPTSVKPLTVLSRCPVRRLAGSRCAASAAAWAEHDQHVGGPMAGRISTMRGSVLQLAASRP